MSNMSQEVLHLRFWNWVRLLGSCKRESASSYSSFPLFADFSFSPIHSFVKDLSGTTATSMWNMVQTLEWFVVLCKTEWASSRLSFSFFIHLSFLPKMFSQRFISYFKSQSLQILYVPTEGWSILCKIQVFRRRLCRTCEGERFFICLSPT